MRFGISSVVAVALLSSCSTLTEDRTPTADCVTGTHWVGGDTGHEEMHPGRDCLGCHQKNDGPPLAIGGTIYGRDGQADDCYGEPGVTVLIKDANNKIFQLETNAAGNFYLEGDDSQIAKPYNVKLRWPSAAAPSAVAPAASADVWANVPPGELERPMPTAVMTGDCGMCHRAELTGATAVFANPPLTYFLKEQGRSDLGRQPTDYPGIDFTKPAATP